MTLEELYERFLDFLEDTKLRLSCLGFIPLELVLIAIIGGITIVSHIGYSPTKQ